MGFISDILGDITTGLIPDEVTSVYETALPQITAPNVSFQPFTVASSVGGVTGGPSGTTLTISPDPDGAVAVMSPAVVETNNTSPNAPGS